MDGYFQLALDEESSKLTTFLLPQEKFRYTKAPMGQNASSDEWCSRSDVVIEGLLWTRKIVDDILVWAETEEEMMERTRIVLSRCKEHNKISREKLELGPELISQNGIRPDDNKYKAIKEFPTPKNLKDLRSFLGLGKRA